MKQTKNNEIFLEIDGTKIDQVFLQYSPAQQNEFNNSNRIACVNEQ